jgi:hypothetical protein
MAMTRHYRDLRQELVREFTERGGKMFGVLKQVRADPSLLDKWEYIYSAQGHELNKADFVDDLGVEAVELAVATTILRESKTIVFSSEQALVFKDLSVEYADSLDFRLPFASVLLQFTEPVPVIAWGTEDTLLGIALKQFVIDEELRQFSLGEAVRVNIEPFVEVGDVYNEMVILFGDKNIRALSWTSNKHVFMEGRKGLPDDIVETWDKVRRLAIACIGYINCVNIELVKEGEVPAKVNAKRERDGKKLLEPYYLCRIKPDGKRKEYAPTEPTGRHVGFRFPVRGHFRRYSSGKTIWVPDHERGLAHELFIPKRYLVE